MSEKKRKCRQYSTEYLKYGFIASPSNQRLPMCLLCHKTFSNESMKPSRLIEHLAKMHPDKSDKDLAYFRSLREQFRKHPTLPDVFSSTSKLQNDGLQASYNVSLMIAKSGKPHTIGEELLLPVVSEILRTVLHKPPAEILKKIPLSNNTVQRRIDEMSRDVEQTLCNFLKNTEFSLQLDESILPGNEALLLAYVRFIKEEQLVQEFLFARELPTDSKGTSIFLMVNEFFKEKEIPLTNIIAVATDGAPSMVGCRTGFISHLKKVVPGVLAIHCVIHRQHLVARCLSERLHLSLQYVISAINRIRGRSLSDRLFRQLCEQNDEDFNRLLLHTDSVLEFLEKEDPSLCTNLKMFEGDIAYMADLYFKFNKMNLQLQGDDLNLVRTKSVINAFVSKLLFFKENLSRKEFCHFPSLCEVHKKMQMNEEDIEVYCHHLEMLHKDFVERFEDILAMDIPTWVTDPFSTIENAERHLQEELLELQANEELKAKLKVGYQRFWLQENIARLHPEIWAVVKKYLLSFPSSYLVERGFSVVTDLLTKKRNRLQIVDRGDLRLRLTNMKPDVQKLVSLYHS
uniref:DUF4371 domain-containing protein n=1 Tax=Trichuris muris TaxID=70415 RepID=A0A5S6Q4E5_TRIMR